MCTHSQTGARVPLQANVWKLLNMAYWKAAKIKLILGIPVRENLFFISMQQSLVSRTLNTPWGWGDNVPSLSGSCVQPCPCRASPPNPHPAASNTHLMPQVRNRETISNEIGNDLNYCYKPLFPLDSQKFEQLSCSVFHFLSEEM